MGKPVPLKDVTLDDKYDLAAEQVFLSGTQAVVRMLLMQQERDRRAGLNTAGFVSGYRGSPLGGLDQQLFRAGKQLKRHDIVFQPGLNEDLAATACWGTQQAEMRGEGKYQGVFALWYGKGPGVDRTGDVFRHANMAGSSKFGGVVCLSGDDHTAESSTNAHQTEFNFVDTMIPILNPAGVQEILDFGLHAFALSRYAGVWVAVKGVKDNVESTASVDGRIDRVSIAIPNDFEMPPGGLNIRPRDNFLEQEARLHEYKRAAVLAYFRANKLDKMIYTGGRKPRMGIISVGKNYLDVMQALDILGIDAGKADRLGLKLLKLASPWPVDPDLLKDFVQDIDLCMVVEEKRSLIEVQVREELYGSKYQPVVVGKKDEQGQWLFPVKGALDPNDIAIAVGSRLLARQDDADLAQRVERIRRAQGVLSETVDLATRTPYFCSGCPHNSSTKVPEGSRAYAGIGCHYMVQWMDRETEGFTQMGGEGTNWIGEAPFSTRDHVFQNLGDGTYNHSGVLALRWAIATKTNITYKILFNDAVAMTGGQHHEGNLTPDMIARQVRAEGVERIAVVSDEPDKYGPEYTWPAGVSFHHRSELMPVQKELAGIPGVTVMIYDQTCAAEKRRRRKRGLYPDPDKRVLINELVCEGCGDCGKASNCVSVQAVDTEFGRKRRIDQSSCNKDFSCLDGFCPSFVTVSGAKPRKLAGSSKGTALPRLPEPAIPDLDKAAWAAIVTGVGGTGVVTIGAILGMAAHLEGRGCGMIDMAGLAQKGGAVFSHIRLAKTPEDIHAIRVSAGMADLILGCDLVVSGSKKVLASVKPGETFFVVNTAEVLPGDFTRNPDYSLPTERLRRGITSAAGKDASGQPLAHFLDATTIATTLFGQSIAANMFLLGYAFQRGAVPLHADSLERAIELNGEAVAMNREAFRWGRAVAHDPELAKGLVAKAQAVPGAGLAATLDEAIARRAEFLTAYQDKAYAESYRRFVARVQEAEAKALPGVTALTEQVAKSLFKLMAYKDEYEVARLYAGAAFSRQLKEAFEGEDMRLTFHLAPPLLAKPDPATGHPRKMSFGPWMMKAFGLLQHFKRFRGTRLDPFGYTAERRDERARVGRYRETVEALLAVLDTGNHALAVEIAGLPQQIRGFGHVRARNAAETDRREAALLARFRNPHMPAQLAAE
ncbi:indolepyruvate ferredoxin oxidoreductase family protein [Rhabdaerophilum sp. SD176]|uniref:indolepyruvate ferredoxin oxidoreductase family protein n=1 Tax=Rhabdaerophilum sp. SD176 TaxID=2983548 RepID=UPI0024E003F4|nr:indolepyruvate ferredoxin oxidoreductase family protein [Rhabdaerophilum sp. SD176]